MFYIKKDSKLFVSLTESGRWNEAQQEADISSSSTESMSAILVSSAHILRESPLIIAIYSFSVGSWKQAKKSRTFKEQRVGYREAREIFEQIF